MRGQIREERLEPIEIGGEVGAGYLPCAGELVDPSRVQRRGIRVPNEMPEASKLVNSPCTPHQDCGAELRHVERRRLQEAPMPVPVAAVHVAVERADQPLEKVLEPRVGPFENERQRGRLYILVSRHCRDKAVQISITLSQRASIRLHLGERTTHES